jgi:hypothetical protein
MYSDDDHSKAINYFLGFPINSLDLSQSYLTGSIIPATSCSIDEFNFERTIDALYPKVYTNPVDGRLWRSHQALSVEIRDDAALRFTFDLNKHKVVAKGKHTLPMIFNIVPGADIDIAVDVTKDDEFDKIAQDHYQAVLVHYRTAQIERRNKSEGYTYLITGLPRQIEIYRSDRRHILTHHVPMTRGYITQVDDKLVTCLSASCLYSYLTRSITNYYYFAGKVSPLEILLKYEQRGFKIKIPSIEALIDKYRKHNVKWLSEGAIYYEIGTQIAKIDRNNENMNLDDIKLDKEMAVRMNSLVRISPAVVGYGNFNALDVFKQLKLLSLSKTKPVDYQDILLGIRPNDVSQDAVPILTINSIDWIKPK